ncbi:MAG: Crp/Fnr family transcriptional regulator [Burkholderiales bacterium]
MMLKSLPLLSALSDDQFAALLPSTQRRTYLARSLILRSGENAEGLYLILSGHVRVLIDSGDSREFIVEVLGPNQFFGEMGLLDGGPCCVTVESQERCEILYMPRKRLLECLQQNANAAMLVLRSTLERLTDAHRKIEGLAMMTVYGRVARVLLENGQETNCEWRVELGTEQIAAMVGASREMVSRVLKEMSETGTIRRDKRKLIVLDRSAVAAGERRTVGGVKSANGMRSCYG